MKESSEPDEKTTIFIIKTRNGPQNEIKIIRNSFQYLYKSSSKVRIHPILKIKRVKNKSTNNLLGENINIWTEFYTSSYRSPQEFYRLYVSPFKNCKIQSEIKTYPILKIVQISDKSIAELTGMSNNFWKSYYIEQSQKKVSNFIDLYIKESNMNSFFYLFGKKISLEQLINSIPEEELPRANTSYYINLKERTIEILS